MTIWLLISLRYLPKGRLTKGLIALMDLLSIGRLPIGLLPIGLLAKGLLLPIALLAKGLLAKGLLAICWRWDVSLSHAWAWMAIGWLRCLAIPCKRG